MVDIGNSSAKAGVLEDGVVIASMHIRSKELREPGNRLYLWMAEWAKQVIGLSFCSVVPAANVYLEKAAEQLGMEVYNLSDRTISSIEIDYPRPSEIGQDRLANALGGKRVATWPLVIIDFGTAVTFDVVDWRGAYCGGVILPGLNLLTSYLHEKTALLPQVDLEDRSPVRAIGKTTVEAIRAGYAYGFEGMVENILAAIDKELAVEDQSGKGAEVITTGGSVPWIAGKLVSGFPYHPDLTFLGLEAGFYSRS